MLMELVDSQFRPSKFSPTFAAALTYVTLTLTLPNALFTFLAFPKEARAARARARAARRRGRPRAQRCASTSAGGGAAPRAWPNRRARARRPLPARARVARPNPRLMAPPTRTQAATHGNAFAIFPQSPAKAVGIVLMVAHQLVAFGLFILPGARRALRFLCVRACLRECGCACARARGTPSSWAPRSLGGRRRGSACCIVVGQVVQAGTILSPRTSTHKQTHTHTHTHTHTRSSRHNTHTHTNIPPAPHARAAVCVMWEKLVRVHYRSLAWRLPARLPVGAGARVFGCVRWLAMMRMCVMVVRAARPRPRPAPPHKTPPSRPSASPPRAQPAPPACACCACPRTHPPHKHAQQACWCGS
jgi:hypothetical protein